MDRVLVLLRDGQSDWSDKNLFTGWKDRDLTLKGIEEARAAGRCLKAQGYFFDRAFASNLVRAQHTLQLVLAELGTPQRRSPTIRPSTSVTMVSFVVLTRTMR